MILLLEGHEVISNFYCQMLPSLNKAYSFARAVSVLNSFKNDPLLIVFAFSSN